MFNFSGIAQKDYKVRVPGAKKLTLLLDTDRDIYGGGAVGLESGVVEWVDEETETVTVSLEAFSGRCYLVE